MKSSFSLTAIALTCAVAACDSAAAKSPALSDSARADSVARARQDSINRAQPGYVVDSILPVEEELRRFRRKIGGAPVTQLARSSASRDDLVRRIVDDVGRNDTTDLRGTLITAREFADLIYPSSPYTRPPYRQAPGLVWTMIQNSSNSGFLRLTRRRGVKGLALKSYECREQPETQGENKLWTDCILHLASAAGEESAQKWFGTIVERNGQYKLLSFRNQF
jgi:hypothetical protein